MEPVVNFVAVYPPPRLVVLLPRIRLFLVWPAAVLDFRCVASTLIFDWEALPMLRPPRAVLIMFLLSVIVRGRDDFSASLLLLLLSDVEGTCACEWDRLWVVLDADRCNCRFLSGVVV